MSKTAGHTAADPAIKAATVIAESVNEQLTDSGLNKGAGYEFVADCAAEFTPLIRNAYAPLLASNLRKVEALRDALRESLTWLRGFPTASTSSVTALAVRKVIDRAEKALALAEEQV